MRRAFQCLGLLVMDVETNKGILKGDTLTWSLERLTYFLKHRRVTLARQGIILRFMSHAAFTEDGQKALFKGMIPQHVEIVTQCLSSESMEVKTQAMCVLRDLSFFSPRRDLFYPKNRSSPQ
eukprot:991795_1